MSSQKTKFTVGLFVACGIGIALLAIVWLGVSRFLEKGQYYVTYFDESVQGLDIDSPVKYRGVSIGRVETIGIAPDTKLIQVVLRIDSDQTLDADMVAQLKAVGITGMMFVELDRKEEGEPDSSPSLNFPSEYQIVASKPSGKSDLLRGVDELLNQTRSIVESAQRILDYQGWDEIMTAMEEASGSLTALLDKANRSMSRVEGIIADDEETLKAAMENFRLAMENANTLLEKGSKLVSGTDDSHSHLKPHLLVVAQNLEKASGNLNRLLDLLADHPSQLILGQPPLPRKLE